MFCQNCGKDNKQEALFCESCGSKLRKEEQLFRSRNFHFPNTVKNDRVIEYIKIDEWGNKLEVLLNCSDGIIAVDDNKEVLFSNLYSNNRLLKNGVLIRKSRS